MGVIAVVIAAAAMLVFGSMVGVYNSDARTYLDRVLPEIMRRWDPRMFAELGGTPVPGRATPEELDRRFAAYRERLGPLVRVQPVQGELNSSSGCEGGPWVYGRYRTVAEFEHGRATVEVAVALVGDRWQIAGLSVDPHVTVAPEGGGRGDLR